MTNQPSGIVFDEDRAAAYDKRFEKMSPIRDAMHLMLATAFSDLPINARILCVGAGTGLELAYLAQRFPQWQFTAVEPAAPMLDLCRRRIETCGASSRCVLHEGYLDSLPASEPFDAATSLLVSHFIMSIEGRVGFFREIAERVKPDGLLVSADLTGDTSHRTYARLLDLWLKMLSDTGLTPKEIEEFRVAYGRDVAILPPAEVAKIIEAGGFKNAALFLQTGLVHAWLATRTSK